MEYNRMAGSGDDILARLFAENETNKSIDALFIVAQHEGCKWADECRRVKDLCRSTRTETGLWSALSRVHYGRRKRTLLMYEARHGRLERVRWLLARGAPTDARDFLGTTALNWASVPGHTDIVRVLISAGAGVDIANILGQTPLWIASLSGHTDIVRVLISAGAGVDIADEDGRTPLWRASFFGRSDIVRELIAAGAGVNIADDRGRTALDAAIHRSHKSAVSTLIGAGATSGPGANDWSVWE